MQPVDHIAPRPWMTAPATATVLAALTAAGAPVRFVGGCVRDTLLDRPVKDVDLATPDDPDAVSALLAAAGLRAIPTGISHGTVTAVVEGRHFEITTLRHDVETFGRHAKVAYTDDWAADAARRDFTMNAIFCDPDGTLYDPCGGLADLRAGRVRFVGDPDQRIQEDLLRLLRFFRFQAHYGRVPPAAEALAACRALAPRLPELSGERVRTELLRLLEASAPVPVLAMMAEEDVLAHALPEAVRFDRLARLVGIEAALGETDAIRRLAAVIDTDRAGVDGLAVRLRLSNAARKRLAGMTDAAERPHPDMDAPAVRRMLYRRGVSLFRDLLLLAWAGAEAGAEDAAYRRLLAAAADWRPVALPVSGADLRAAGVPTGPEVGRLLAEVESWWIDGDFRADRAACLEELHARLAATR